MLPLPGSPGPQHPGNTQPSHRSSVTERERGSGTQLGRTVGTPHTRGGLSATAALRAMGSGQEGTRSQTPSPRRTDPCKEALPGHTARETRQRRGSQPLSNRQAQGPPAPRRRPRARDSGSTHPVAAALLPQLQRRKSGALSATRCPSGKAGLDGRGQGGAEWASRGLSGPSGEALPDAEGGALEEVDLSGRPPLAAGEGAAGNRGLYRIEAGIPKTVNTLILPLTRRPSTAQGETYLERGASDQSSNRQR